MGRSSRRSKREDVRRVLATDVTGSEPPADEVRRLASLAAAAPTPVSPVRWWRRAPAVAVFGVAALAGSAGVSFAAGVVETPWSPPEHTPSEPGSSATVPSTTDPADERGSSAATVVPTPPSTTPSGGPSSQPATSEQATDTDTSTDPPKPDDRHPDGTGPSAWTMPPGSTAPVPIPPDTTPGQGTGRGRGNGPPGSTHHDTRPDGERRAEPDANGAAPDRGERAPTIPPTR